MFYVFFLVFTYPSMMIVLVCVRYLMQRSIFITTTKFNVSLEGSNLCGWRVCVYQRHNEEGSRNLEEGERIHSEGERIYSEGEYSERMYGEGERYQITEHE